MQFNFNWALLNTCNIRKVDKNYLHYFDIFICMRFLFKFDFWILCHAAFTVIGVELKTATLSTYFWVKYMEY